MAGLLVPASPASAEGAGAEGPATSRSTPTTLTTLDTRDALITLDASGSHAQTVVDDTETGTDTDTGEPATYIGLVFRSDTGHLASKVRAIGADGTVCGTAEVRRLDSGDGWYRLDAASADTRPGCPGPGDSLAFRLLYGSVDSGRAAIVSQPVSYAAGERFLVSLTPTPDATRVDWLGQLDLTAILESRDSETTGVRARLTWIGPDGTPTGDALASLGLDTLTPGGDDAPRVIHASHYDAASGEWTSYTPGGPSFLQTYATVAYGDVVYLRLR